MPGIATLAAEVTNVSKHCFWLLLDDEELAIQFSEFPWFKSATIERLSEIERPTENHLYWPELDVDLSVESIRKPEDFPLISKVLA
ncbi:DUF2442 domain-containing protein [uncultured Thiodictyon sp.]|uniref:DUF2442 domain-containing protein n=1 Tax=uncultured Thiodictyon sp. TaxID=1846217 RepID=UPI0025E3D6FB|nr:DUF2442 domain-containing protein [uncultured Thiodictyon sp.]